MHNMGTATFTLLETDSRRIVINQFKAQTHVHGFHDEAPTEWKDVYKTYYSYDIVHYPLNDEGDIDLKHSKTLFDMPCDESSAFPDLPKAIKSLADTGDKVQLRSCGDGADWNIERKATVRSDGTERIWYDFEVFDSYYGNGCRFRLYEEDIDDFVEWLEEVNADALTHSEGI